MAKDGGQTIFNPPKLHKETQRRLGLQIQHLRPSFSARVFEPHEARPYQIMKRWASFVDDCL
jgi:hypothetical protein